MSSPTARFLWFLPHCAVARRAAIGGLLAVASIAQAAPDFEAETIDDDVAIGYGLGIGDVDGDGKSDILLADKKAFVWYRNPDWKRFVLWENPRRLDNVCIAARDIDGDGKVEIAVGAEWNPGDTRESGSVHWLVRPEDPTQPWGVVDLHREPTVHRMRWVEAPRGDYRLVVAPLHGRGNSQGAGEGVRILAYDPPEDAKNGDWDLELVDGGMHMSHNIDPVNWDDDPEEEILVAGKEGIFLCDRGADRWTARQIAGNAPGETSFPGASEVRLGNGASGGGARFLATIEPFHGNSLVVYTRPSRNSGARERSSGGGRPRLWTRQVIDDDLSEGHAIACADIDADGADEIVAGWRGKGNASGHVGIRIYDRGASSGGEWRAAPLDDDGMACEDLRIADIDGDGDLDIVAAGRSTHNLKIYRNPGRNER